MNNELKGRVGEKEGKILEMREELDRKGELILLFVHEMCIVFLFG